MANATIVSKGTGKQRGKRPARRLFDVDEYYRMVKAGILHDDDRVELIEGEIIEMAPIGDKHGACVMGLNDRFGERLRGRAMLGVQTSLRLTQRLELQPDVMLVRRREDRYWNGHPTAVDVLLLIEVADSSLRYDRSTKLQLYAREGIPEVWIVDLRGQRVEAYRDPANGRYQNVETFARGSSLSPLAFPDVSISVDEILG